jgi:indole-3-glycerol phosphate synthase
MVAGLDHIVAASRRRVSEARGRADVRLLERQAEGHEPRGFRNSLAGAAESGIAVIAELKKASPSKGLIRPDFDAAGLAAELAAAGAAALSVLTDEEFFHGSLGNLAAASAASGLPCLRKDFIVDEFQILEARAHHADAVLLIVAALSTQELGRFVKRAGSLQLNVLCEVHDESELQQALDAGCDMVGVNNRDLRTFEVNLETGLRLGRMIPKNVLSVAESGIHSRQDIARLRAEGYRGFLIGESLMKAASPGEALRALLVATTQDQVLRTGN